MHCCKLSKYDFYIAQGSVATVLRWGGKIYSHLLQVSSRCCMPKNIISQSFTDLFKNYPGTFFWDTVENYRPRKSASPASVNGCLPTDSNWTLLWAGSRHSVSQFQGHGPAIQLGADTVLPCDHARLIRVIISAALSLDRHASAVCATSFYWLRQLRWVCRSLDTESAVTFVHAVVTSKVDYCNLLLAGLHDIHTDHA